MYGIEKQLLFLYIMLYTAIDIYVSFELTYVAFLTIFLLDRLLVKIRVYFGERNLAAKTLIDRKFIL